MTQDWVTIKLPVGIWAKLAEALYLKERLVEFDGQLPADPDARRLDLLEGLIAEWLHDAGDHYAQLLEIHFAHADPNKALERRGKWAALVRDGFRSVLSGHTLANQPGRIVVHHIWPVGQYGEGRPAAIHDPSNLATLTDEEHQRVHGDWRKWLPELREKIGEASS